MFRAVFNSYVLRILEFFVGILVF
ncbi:hypothetical protein AB3N59_05965 [Leptospira sp. WS92.C1]